MIIVMVRAFLRIYQTLAGSIGTYIFLAVRFSKYLRCVHLSNTLIVLKSNIDISVKRLLTVREWNNKIHHHHHYWPSSY